MRLPGLPDATRNHPNRQTEPQPRHPQLELLDHTQGKEKPMRNIICAALTTITLALCVALAGCGSAAKASTQAHAAKPIDSQCTDGGTAHGFYECSVTLSDTRKVDCVVYA
jgi:hypothetical protein